MEARTRLFGEIYSERCGVNSGTLTPPASQGRPLSARGDEITVIGRSA